MLQLASPLAAPQLPALRALRGQNPLLVPVISHHEGHEEHEGNSKIKTLSSSVPLVSKIPFKND